MMRPQNDTARRALLGIRSGHRRASRDTLVTRSMKPTLLRALTLAIFAIGGCQPRASREQRLLRFGRSWRRRNRRVRSLLRRALHTVRRADVARVRECARPRSLSSGMHERSGVAGKWRDGNEPRGMRIRARSFSVRASRRSAARVQLPRLARGRQRVHEWSAVSERNVLGNRFVHARRSDRAAHVRHVRASCERRTSV